MTSKAMTKTEALQKLADIALAQVGTKEVGGNNRGPKIVQYQKATWLDPAPWPWCAAFVCWCIREWLEVPGVAEAVGVAQASLWRPQTAGAWDFARWAKQHRLEVVDEDHDARAGDLIIFDFSHIGIVVEDSFDGKTPIVTVEGNTNGRGERDSESGDGVWKKVRARHLAKQFVRLA